MNATAMHAAVQLIGGRVPEHEPGAYPRLSCCGGPLRVADLTVVREGKLELPEPDFLLIDYRVSERSRRRLAEREHADWHHAHPDRVCARQHTGAPAGVRREPEWISRARESRLPPKEYR